MLRWAFIGIVMSLGLAAQATAQNLPSGVEQQLGIPPNSANPGGPYYGRFEYRERRGERTFADDRLARCQSRAHRRGLDGWEFRRFMRYCMDRWSTAASGWLVGSDWVIRSPAVSAGFLMAMVAAVERVRPLVTGGIAGSDAAT
jgi:hypothetical protein